MTTSLLRIMIADDERPARAFLASLLESFAGVEIVGAATNGAEALEFIEQAKPDLALLDLQMPELDGLSVARLIKPELLPLIAFVTAFDEYAVRAFELNAIDYLLKPVARERLQATLERARARLSNNAAERAAASEKLQSAIVAYETEMPRRELLERIPVRRRDEILLVPVGEIVAIIADGELLHITTTRNEKHVINYRLKDLETRLDAARFVRLGRGAIASVEQIRKVNLMPGGNYTVTLANNQELAVSRTQSRVLREQLLKL